jgi:hypothetical protein
VQVKGLIDALDIDVGGKNQASDIHCRRIRVGGGADIQNLYFATPRGLEFLDTYWKMKVFQEIFSNKERKYINK